LARRTTRDARISIAERDGSLSLSLSLSFAFRLSHERLEIYNAEAAQFSKNSRVILSSRKKRELLPLYERREPGAVCTAVEFQFLARVGLSALHSESLYFLQQWPHNKPVYYTHRATRKLRRTKGTGEKTGEEESLPSHYAELRDTMGSPKHKTGRECWSFCTSVITQVSCRYLTIDTTGLCIARVSAEDRT